MAVADGAVMHRYSLRDPFSRPFRANGHGAACAKCAIAAIVAVISLGCSSASSSTNPNASAKGDDTYETTVEENPLRADPIDDTAPPYASFDASLDFNGHYGVPENHSTDRFRFDVVAYQDDAQRIEAETLYPSYAQFFKAHQQGAMAVPSVQTVVTYMKQLDDTLYAGVERAAQDGLAPTIESKRTVLRGVLDYLAAHRSSAADEAFVTVAAAARLGGDPPTVPDDLTAQVDAVQKNFLATPAESKPIGFYTWSSELKAIWQQDRLLQRDLPSPASTCALATAIAADPGRRSQYENLVLLYDKLTNPVKSSLVDLLSGAAAGMCEPSTPKAFLSRSRTPEVALFHELYPDGVPPDADLMGDLVRAIRNGSVDLTPASTDGWYQYQLYGLETLLVTDRSEERTKIGFTARYKQHLEEAFSTLLVQHRETHVKQVDTSTGSSGEPPPPTPLRVEPLATVYVRHARSYVFLERALEGVLGAQALDTAVAVDQGGNTTTTLRMRIHRARDLFYGLYLVSTQDVGMGRALGVAGDPSADEWTTLVTAAVEWLAQLPNDEIAASDVRVMVPIAQLPFGRYKYWAVIGVRATLAGYSPIYEMDMSPPALSQVTSFWLPTEQFLEVVSSDVPMTRDELRALCDEKKTAAAIKTAIEARP
jgi:hypothetical protein